MSRSVNNGASGAGYYLDGNQMLEEKGSAGTVQYTWGNGLVRRGSEYPMTDGQGTTKLVTNSSQTITSTQDTEAFGRTIATTGSTSSPFGYHGAEGYRSDGDGPAGLEPYQKVGARYYDATFGRFITRDTELDQSPYAYCDGDPVNSDDPSGHLSAVNIASGGVSTINGPGGTGSGLMMLSGTVKGTVTSQGNKTTTTASVSGTEGKTTGTVTVTQVATPFHDPITTATVSGTYQLTPSTGLIGSYTTGAPGTAPSVSAGFVITFGPPKPKPSK